MIIIFFALNLVISFVSPMKPALSLQLATNTQVQYYAKVISWKKNRWRYHTYRERVPYFQCQVMFTYVECYFLF